MDEDSVSRACMSNALKAPGVGQVSDAQSLGMSRQGCFSMNAGGAWHT